MWGSYDHLFDEKHIIPPHPKEKSKASLRFALTVAPGLHPLAVTRLGLDLSGELNFLYQFDVALFTVLSPRLFLSSSLCLSISLLAEVLNQHILFLFCSCCFLRLVNRPAVGRSASSSRAQGTASCAWCTCCRMSS